MYKCARKKNSLQCYMQCNFHFSIIFYYRYLSWIRQTRIIVRKSSELFFWKFVNSLNRPIHYSISSPNTIISRSIFAEQRRRHGGPVVRAKRKKGGKKKRKSEKWSLLADVSLLNRRADVYVYLTRQLCIFARHKRNGAAEAPWGCRNGVSMPRHYPVIIGTQIFPD